MPEECAYEAATCHQLIKLESNLRTPEERRALPPRDAGLDPPLPVFRNGM